MSDAESQSIYKHMAKFKVRMSCKQYIKNKPIKWGFKWWFWCYSKTGYLLEFDIYLSKNEKTELGLGKIAVLGLSKKLENTHFMLYCDNFFSSPTLFENLLDGRIHFLGTVGSDRKNMAIMKKARDVKRGDIDFQYFNITITWLLWNELIIIEWQWLLHVLRNVIKYQQLLVE